jgi:hypothetical protein
MVMQISAQNKFRILISDMPLSFIILSYIIHTWVIKLFHSPFFRCRLSTPPTRSSRMFRLLPRSDLSRSSSNQPSAPPLSIRISNAASMHHSRSPTGSYHLTCILDSSAHDGTRTSVASLGTAFKSTLLPSRIHDSMTARTALAWLV